MVVATLREAGLDRAANRVERCGRDGLVQGCSGRDQHYRKLSLRCGHRICPDCAPKRSGRLAATYQPGIDAFAYPVLLTLTIKNLPTLHREDLQAMKRAFAKLRRRRAFVGHEHNKWCARCPNAEHHDDAVTKARAFGGAVGWSECRAGCGCPGERAAIPAGLCALEVTASEEKGFHPHFHVLCDVPDFVSVFEIGDAWRECCAAEGLTVGEYGADVASLVTFANRKSAKGKTVTSREAATRYVLKYVCKSDVPEAMRPQYAAAVARVRLVQPFGALTACPTKKVARVSLRPCPNATPCVDFWSDGRPVTEADRERERNCICRACQSLRAAHDRQRACVCPACRVKEARREKRKLLPICPCCATNWAGEERVARGWTDEEHGAMTARILALADRDYTKAVKAFGELCAAGVPVACWESYGLFSGIVKWVYERADQVPDALLSAVDAWVRAEVKEGESARAN